MDALGLYAEGQLVKLAHVRKSKNRLVILALESVVLPLPVERERPGNGGVLQEYPADAAGDASPTRVQDRCQDTHRQEKYGGENAFDSVQSRVGDERSNVECLVELLRKYPLGKAPVALGMLEPAVRYVTFTDTESRNGLSLTKKLAGELRRHAIPAGESDSSEPHYIRRDDTHFLIQHHSGTIPLLDEILRAKSLMKRKMSIGRVTSPSVALAQLAHAAGEPAVSLIVHIGSDFSRILLLDGGIIVQVSPVINIEKSSKDFLHTVYARILFMLDHTDVPPPGKILLSGDLQTDRSKDYFTEKFDGTPVLLITETSVLDTSLCNPESDFDGVSYAVPIGLAAGLLDRSERAYRYTDFLPARIKKDQRSSRLAWHGFAVVALLFLSALFYTFRWHDLTRRITEVEFSLALTEESLNVETAVAGEIAVMEKTAEKYRAFHSLVDSLRSAEPVYSETFLSLAAILGNLNSMWLENVTMTGNSLTITGSSLYRSRIHRFAQTAGDAVIKSMREDDIRGRPVYNFELLGKPLKSAGQGDSRDAVAGSPLFMKGQE